MNYAIGASAHEHSRSFAGSWQYLVTATEEEAVKAPLGKLQVALNLHHKVVVGVAGRPRHMLCSCMTLPSHQTR